LVCLTLISYSQQTDRRPKIGLVLSGGAAKGFAHIGVIKYLEELGIEADYVTGSSMGSIIGGLYAMGFNSDQMYEIAASQDWELLLSGNIELKDVAPLEKPFHQKFPFYLAYENGTVTLPRGVINSQKLDLLLSAIFSPAYQVTDFDKLHVPFRCVAVNLENGDVKVFSKGNLAKSIRASMAIPGVFTPEEIDNELYVDGGVIRNFPVEEIIELGADLVIGVYVGANLKQKEEINSMFDVISQTTFMMGSLDSEEQIKDVNILITPDISDINSFAFEDYDKIISLGYESVQQSSTQLKQLATKLDRFPKKEVKRSMPKPEYLFMKKVEFPETESPFDDLGRFKFGNYRRGTLTLERIEKGVTRIVGTKLYDKVSYSFNTSSKELAIDIDAKVRETILFSGALNAFASTNTSFIVHSSLYNIFTKPSTLKFTARLSEFIGLQGLYQLRIGPNRNWLVNLNGKFDKIETPLYDRGKRLNSYNEFDSDVGLFFGYEPNNTSYLEIGGGIKRRRLRQRNFAFENFEEYQNTFQFIGLNANFNILDRLQFPKYGLRASLNSQLVFGQDVDVTFTDLLEPTILDIPETKNYVRARLNVLGVWSFFDIITLETRVNVAYKSNPSLLDNVKFGGLTQERTDGVSFIGIEEGQNLFSNFFSVRQDIRVNLFGPVYIGGIVSYVNGDRAFLANESTVEEEDSILGYGGGIYIRTPVGPLSLELGRTIDNSELNSVVGFGFRYIY